MASLRTSSPQPPPMDSFKRICGLILNDPDLYDIRATHLEKTIDQLEKNNVPVSEDPCRTCANPCEFGHPDYPTRFNVDQTSDMLGSIKPYQRQIVISTGKSDWEREVTDEKDSLAHFLSQTSKRHRRPSFSALSPLSPRSKRTGFISVPGVFNSSDASRLSILNGSHHTVSYDDDKESVLVFPDYKVVKDVPRSSDGAEQLWRGALDPGVSRAGSLTSGGETRSWPLQYACVILLCSHKKRDNRCHIAAPKLESALTHSLESEGYEVHTQLEEPEGPPLEAIKGPEEDREQAFLDRLQTIASADEPKKALILKTSHIGGHKYSGNVVIYTPQGSGVWYGRVTPHEVPAVVKTTICEGKVLPALLRGGVNLTRPQGKDLLAW